MIMENVNMGRNVGKKDMVFCIIFADKATPYENYDCFLNSDDENIRNKANMNVPMVLAQMRWDGKLGFPGGNVESHHNTLIEAIKSELEEEINLININEDNLIPLVTFSDEKKHISSFAYKVTYEELKEIQKNSFNSKHFYTENCGSVLFQIHEKSVDNLKQQVFSGTGKDELLYLIEKMNLI